MGDKKSPTRPKRHAKPSPDDGFWDCSVCTFKNSAEAFKCSMCDVRKGTSTRKPRINSQLVAQQVAQQFATPPPPKKERRERLDRDRHDLDLPDDEHLDTDHSDSDRLSSVHPDSDTSERPHRMEDHMDRERRLERLGLERGREVGRGRAEQDRQLPERAWPGNESPVLVGLVDKMRPNRPHVLHHQERQSSAGSEVPEQEPESGCLVRDQLKKDKAERDKAERDKAERDKAERDKAERDKAERDKAERDKAERDKGDNDPDKHSNAAKGGPVLIKKPTAKKTKPRLIHKGLPSEKNSVKSGKSAAKKNNRLISRPRLKNIDRSSAQQLAITVGNVTVIITDFKEKTRSSSTSSSTVTSSVGSDQQNHTSGSESTDRGSSRASTPRGELSARHDDTL
ncbi:hypothetical protein ACEWY4_000902 [Coilia grayii]|uniref:RanBP2-type domain-containing protein n=1 Tax=Coilia grayii TaxID=363190 RepID=A0ABD1KXZ6_9TELE